MDHGEILVSANIFYKVVNLMLFYTYKEKILKFKHLCPSDVMEYIAQQAHIYPL
jgi:hypothetical protein